jgi:aryl-phospho-beta-D-glucosidase BglC (GH1 family)
MGSLKLNKLKRIVPLCALILIALLLLFTALQSLLKSPTSNSFVGTKGTGVRSLQTSGRNIYDGNGAQVKLNACVIFDGDGAHIEQSDIQKIKDMGFNAIRLFIEWGNVQPAANSVNTAYFTQASEASPTIGVGVDYVVNWAVNASMYVIICPGWSSYWAPPSWATSLSGSAGVTAPDAPDICVDAFYNSQVQSGIYYMYNWMAQHYAANSNVIFESFNELESESRPANSTERAAFAAFNNGWISAVESGEGANSHLKIVQMLCDWSQWNYVLTGPFVDGSHSNIILATHSYPLVKSSPSLASQTARVWANAVHSQNLPWVDTEFGHCQGGDLTGVSQAISLFNGNNAAGWGYFCYSSTASSQSSWNVNNPVSAASILPTLFP